MKRLVRLHIKEDKIDTFIQLFENSKDKIKGFPGCQHVELLQGRKDNRTFFTFSIWDDESDLENYRASDLFKGIWQSTKLLFEDRADAWSVDQVG